MESVAVLRVLVVMPLEWAALRQVLAAILQVLVPVFSMAPLGLVSWLLWSMLSRNPSIACLMVWEVSLLFQRVPQLSQSQHFQRLRQKKPLHSRHVAQTQPQLLPAH